MKKLLTLLALICCCVILVGCGGSGNSFDRQNISNLSVTVPVSILELPYYASTRAAVNIVNPKLEINGVILNQWLYNNDKTCVIFKRAIYVNDETYNILNKPVFEFFNNNNSIYKFQFASLTGFPENFVIKYNKEDNSFSAKNGDKDVVIEKINDKPIVPPVEDNKIVLVNIKKQYSPDKVCVTFYNSNDKEVTIDNYATCEWTIGVTDNSDKTSLSLSNEEGLFDIKYNDTVKCYEITLTEKGKIKAGSRKLSDLEGRIEILKNASGEVLVDSKTEQRIEK